jgi:hypothetical protein
VTRRATHRALPPLVLAVLTGCQASGEGRLPPHRPTHSHVALFRIDTKELEREGPHAVDPAAESFLEKCIDGRLSLRLRDAIDAECGPATATLLPRAFNNNLDYAWDLEPAPELAIVAKMKRHESAPEDKVGGAVAGTIGWLIIGLPGYLISDFDHYPPIELSITLYEGVARSDRNLGTFAVGNQPVPTNFLDRNGTSVMPYVMTILIPPHFVSKFDEGDPEAVADLLIDAVVRRAARGIGERVRSWELLTPDTGGGG